MRSSAEGFVVYETAKREVTALTVAGDGTIYVAAIGEKTRAEQLPHPRQSSPPRKAPPRSRIRRPPCSPQGAVPFLNFPPSITSSIYRLVRRRRAGRNLEFARRRSVRAGIERQMDACWQAPETPDRCWSLMAAVFTHNWRNLARHKLPGLPEIPPESFSVHGKSRKSFFCWPGIRGGRHIRIAVFRREVVFAVGTTGMVGSGRPAGALSDKSAKKVDSTEPRLEFFVRSGNTEDPGKEWSKWFGPYSKSGTAVEAPAARFFQWKAVIHDGRTGDGIDWVSEAYLAQECCAGHRWNCRAGSRGARAGAASDIRATWQRDAAATAGAESRAES